MHRKRPVKRDELGIHTNTLEALAGRNRGWKTVDVVAKLPTMRPFMINKDLQE